MKNLLFLLVGFALVLASCSKEEEIITSPAPNKYTIIVAAEAGGSVSSQGGTYNEGSKITITATPDGQYLFEKWSDGSTVNPREITVTDNLTLSATFIKKTYPLSVTIEGEGTVQEEVIIQGSTSETTYNAGTTVRLTATPNEYWEFSSWILDGEVLTENPVEVVIEKGRQVKALFEIVDYNLIEAPSNFQVTPGVYSAVLEWDQLNDPRIDSIIIYKGKDPGFLDRYVTMSNNTASGSFADTFLGVRQRYYFKMQYQIGDSVTSFTPTLEIQAIEPSNNSTPINDEIGGIHYAYWDFPIQTFEEISHRFTIYENPTNIDGSENGDGLYYQFYQGILNDTIGFYYGIQTRLYKPGSGYGRGIIFSRWKTRELENLSIPSGSWGESAGYEGDFIGLRKHYDWDIGNYEITLKKDSVDALGDWYSLKIKSLPGAVEDYIGSIRFERSSNSLGIKSGGITWTELYSKVPPGTPMPNWRVSIDDVRVNKEFPPNRVYVTYNQNRFVDFYNIFTTNRRDVHFLMGPRVKKVTSPGYLWNN